MLRVEKPWACLNNFRLSEPEYAKFVRSYWGMISLMDHHIGRITDGLAARNQLDNTLIVFTSDHGEYLGNHRVAMMNDAATGHHAAGGNDHPRAAHVVQLLRLVDRPVQTHVVREQPAAAVLGIRSMISLFPPLALVIGFFLLGGYSLHGERLEEVQSDVAELHEQKREALAHIQ